ncbi:TetR/AcrR family transcriptional regulator [Actinomadura darangshiensis]|uniref:TetR/AcrR family transcriptional regulator n=1 Tax=Actinomadura darangshiensis TaxID=705336 RepID=A0A4V2YR26_9ACTN|nr:TetR/AcrR family transcriptional regulator [Actinomadura darangshiensis]
MRAEAAQETRRRILDAVYERLREAPSEPVSIDGIARSARVARPTVYQVFGSRAGLFEAVGADLLDRGGFQDMLRASAHPDAREALRGGVHGVVAMYATHRDILRVLHSMAMLDATAVGGAVQRLEQRRSQGMAHVAQRLADQNVLRTDVSHAEATDVLCLLTSFDSFDHLYTARGRPCEAVAEALTATAARTLCT